MSAMFLAVPVLGLLAIALGTRKRKALPEVAIVAPEVPGEPVTVVSASGEQVQVTPAIQAALDAGDEDALTAAIEDAEISIEQAADDAVEAIENAAEEVRSPGFAPMPLQSAPTFEAPAAQVIESIPTDTEMLAAAMIAREGTSGWKFVDPAVAAWQASRGLVADGMFGPKSGVRMGSEIGTLPLVRYWPKASYKSTAVPAYRAELDALADDAPEPRASALRASALREAGQGYGSGTSGATATAPKAVTDNLSDSWRETLSSGTELSGLASLIAQFEDANA